MTDPRLAEADRAIRLAEGYEQHARNLTDEAQAERQRARRIRSEVNRSGKERVDPWPGCFPPCAPQDGCAGCAEARAICEREDRYPDGTLAAGTSIPRDPDGDAYDAIHGTGEWAKLDDAVRDHWRIPFRGALDEVRSMDTRDPRNPGTATGRTSCSEPNLSGPVLEPLPVESIRALQQMADDLTDREDEAILGWLKATAPTAEAIQEFFDSLPPRNLTYVAVACEDHAGIFTVLIPLDGARSWEASVAEAAGLGYGNPLNARCCLHHNVVLADDVADACPWQVTFTNHANHATRPNREWTSGNRFPTARGAHEYAREVVQGTARTSFRVERAS